jgi:hypothetical protein
LCFGTRAEQAGDIQPDIESNCIHWLIVEYGYDPFQE